MSTTLNILTIVGARPQFIKAAAVSRAIAAANRPAPGGTGFHPVTSAAKHGQDARATDNKPAPVIDETLIHTGQHYDPNLSQVFFDELNIPQPRHHLGVGSDTHARQTATMLERLEPILLEHKPDWVLIYGDTNSTLAGALAAAKLHIPIAHVEAGLRSRNRRMAEEINRIIADRLSTLLLCPTKQAVQNLAQEGVSEGVHDVGDVMYDSVLHHSARAEQTSTILRDLHLAPKSYALATIHRAEITDDPQRLNAVLEALTQMGEQIIIPLHPRTAARLGSRVQGPGFRVQAGDESQSSTQRAIPDTPIPASNAALPMNTPSSFPRQSSTLRYVPPVPYLDMLTLEKNASMIFTDSGGVQKEAYFFNVPCITLREETEWTELVDIGANRLAGHDTAEILRAAQWAADWKPSKSTELLYGNGRAAERIVELLLKTAATAF